MPDCGVLRLSNQPGAEHLLGTVIWVYLCELFVRLWRYPSTSHLFSIKICLISYEVIWWTSTEGPHASANAQCHYILICYICMLFNF